MKKAKATANEPTIIERHNALFEQIEAAKTADDVRTLVEAVKGFIVSYKSVDKAMTKRVYEKLLKQHLMNCAITKITVFVSWC